MYGGAFSAGAGARAHAPMILNVLLTSDMDQNHDVDASLDGVNRSMMFANRR
jgi:hypothetical protein